MAGVWHDEGENNILNAYLKGTNRPGDSWYLGLYTNSTALAENATLASINELSGNGYSRQLVQDSEWTVSGSEATGAQKTFTASGGNWTNIYGWFLTNVASGTSGILIASEHFSGGPYNVPDGGSLKLTPHITAS